VSAPAAGLAPPGRAIEISWGDQRAVVTESGATLRCYDVAGRPVVEPFDGPEAPVVGCQGEVLAPWPNRVADGRWTWRGEVRQLSLTEPERGHALHGLVRSLSWTVVEHHGDRLALEVLLLAHPGWPFPLHASMSYLLDAGGLSCTLTATNVGREPCPYGAAFHPYLAVPGGRVDDAVLHVDAATWLETDDRLTPVARRAAHGTPFDFTDGAPIGARRADTAFTDLARGAGGRVEALVTAPDGRTAVVWGDESVRWWQVFTGDALPERWRRTTLAVEPMTCAPDALNSGDGLVVLEPGERHTTAWGLALT
jgi:aldose 1-epimerase